MKKKLCIILISYIFILATSCVLFFVNFNVSGEIDFVLKLLSLSLLCFFTTLPISIISINKIQTSIGIKVLMYFLFVLFVGFAGLVAFDLLFKLQLVLPGHLTEEFYNLLEDDEILILALLITQIITSLIMLLKKVKKGRGDWIFFVLYPLSLINGVLLLIAIPFAVIFFLYKIVIYDLIIKPLKNGDSYESDATSSRKEGFYDANGFWRTKGEQFYDGAGNLITPGEDSFIDGRGFKREPGEGYYDYEGNYIDSGISRL